MMKALSGVELKRFLRHYRRDNAPGRRVSAVLQSVAYPYNVGAIFRLADGAKLDELILCGITPQPPHPTIDKVSRYKAKNVAWRYEPDPLQAVNDIKSVGFRVVALELVDSAKPYHQHNYTDRTCLVVGNEDHGLTKAVLGVCDEAVFVPMYGKGRSLNVQTALAIVTYHILHSQ